MEGDFQVCGNCKRKVASAHFALHEAHCLRFLALCPECEEPVPEAAMEEHLQTKHQQHREDGPLPAKCRFCKLAVSLSRLEAHEFQCGSRTEHCLHCDQPVPLQELAQHQGVCQKGQAQLREGRRISSLEWKIRCDYCNQMIPENEYVHHMDKCCPVSEPTKYPLSGKPKLPLPSSPTRTSTTEEDVRPKTKNINRSLLSESSTKQSLRGKNRPMALPLESELKPRTSSPAEDEAAFNILRRCCQCGILLPLPILQTHQGRYELDTDSMAPTNDDEKCLWLASSKGKQVRKAS